MSTMDMDEDVSASLLASMNSLQTLDHDDLVSQMVRLVGGSGGSGGNTANNGNAANDLLSVETAKFYLDMNGWNVQAAVCAYFDLEAGPEAKQAIPSMTFIKDVTIGEGESVPPDTLFVKTWKVQNTGAEKWPELSQLRHTQGTLMTSDRQDRIPVHELLPWQMADLSIEMKSPKDPGIYESKWRMSTNSGMFFGDTIWVIITVEPTGTLALTQQMNNFHDLGCSSTSPYSASASSTNVSLHNQRANFHFSSDMTNTNTPQTFDNPFSSTTPRKTENSDQQQQNNDEEMN